MNTNYHHKLKSILLTGAYLLLMSGCATSVGEHNSQVASFSIDGDMGYMSMVVHANSPQKDIISIYSTGAPGGCSSNMGQPFFVLQGTHKLFWKTKQGVTSEIDGRAWLGLRSDSPKRLDVAFTSESASSLPAELLAIAQRQRMLNADSVFLTDKFPDRDKIVLVCKIEALSDKTFRLVEQ